MSISNFQTNGLKSEYDQSEGFNINHDQTEGLKSNLAELKTTFTKPKVYLSDYFTDLRNKIDIEYSFFKGKKTVQKKSLKNQSNNNPL